MLLLSFFLDFYLLVSLFDNFYITTTLEDIHMKINVEMNIHVLTRTEACQSSARYIFEYFNVTSEIRQIQTWGSLENNLILNFF